MAERPTREDVFALKEERKGKVYGAMHANMRRADHWVFADDAGDDGKGSPILDYVGKGFDDDHVWEIYPFAWEAVDQAIAQYYTGAVPQVTVIIDPKEKRRAPKTADAHEKLMTQAAQGIMHRIPTQELVDAAWQQLSLGMMVLHYPPDARYGKEPDHGKETPDYEEAWEAYEAQDCLPWAVTSLHPTWVYPDPHNGDRPRDYIIERTVQRDEMQRKFPQLQFGKADTEDCTYTEYVSAKHYGCWVNDRAVTPGAAEDSDGIVDNPMGHTWATMAISGMGKSDDKGSWSRKATGIVQRGIGTFIRMTRDDNLMAAVKRTYIPKYVWSDTTVEQAVEASEDFDPGNSSLVRKANTATVEALAGLMVPDAVIKDIQVGGERLERLYSPGTLGGESRSEAASKYAQRIAQAQGPLETPKTMFEQALSRMLWDFFWDIKHDPHIKDFSASYSDKEDHHYSGALKPEEIHMNCKILVDITPQTDQEKAFEFEDAQAKVEAGFWPRELAIKASGKIDNIAEAESKIALDKWVQSSPAFVQLMDSVLIPKLAEAAGVPNPLAPPMMPGAAPSGAEASPGAPGAGGGPSAPLAPGVPQTPGPPPGSGQEAIVNAQNLYPSQNGQGQGFPAPAGERGRYNGG